jgi:uncharacterized protein (DUF2236 family)
MSAYFTPRTVFWKVNSHALVNLSGSRALMLELAHPLIAAGVAEHSNYQGDPFGRLMRTMRTMSRLMFTDSGPAHDALRHFNGCHAKVEGALTETVGPLEAGTPYAARDPHLKLWVLATLYDSCLLVYDTLVAPLTLEDKRAYYQDGLILGHLLGIPFSVLPPTYDDFDAYVQGMIHSDTLTVGDQARAIADALWAAPLFGPVAKAASYVGLGLLPTHLREQFGFPWVQADVDRLAWIARTTQRLNPWVPGWVTTNPEALLAEWRGDWNKTTGPTQPQAPGAAAS